MELLVGLLTQVFKGKMSFRAKLLYEDRGHFLPSQALFYKIIHFYLIIYYILGMTTFEFTDYKSFLKNKICENSGVFGYKGKLANAAGCHRAYLSQVLNSHIHLTPDHAAGLALFWSLGRVERDYFLEMVNHARAATPTLRKMIDEKLALLKAKNTTVSGRIKKPKIESPMLQMKYYSSWHYSAIHIILTVSKFRNISVIAERLGISKSAVSAALTTLALGGLVEKKGENWVPTSYDLHLPNQSPLGSNNHLNWRGRAIQDSQNTDSDGVHFTAVYSLSEKDFQKIRNLLLELVSKTRETALASNEEDVFSFCCDLFRV
jgi:uncharacterized protein (TIGR02147 family)